MEPEVWAVVGILVLVLFVSAILIVPLYVENSGLKATKQFYEDLVDSLVVAASAFVAMLTFVVAVGVYLAHRGVRDAYILGAVFLLTVEILLSTLQTFTGLKWLLDSVLHLINLGAVFLLFLALRE